MSIEFRLCGVLGLWQYTFPFSLCHNQAIVPARPFEQLFLSFPALLSLLCSPHLTKEDRDSDTLLSPPYFSSTQPILDPPLTETALENLRCCMDPPAQSQLIFRPCSLLDQNPCFVLKTPSGFCPKPTTTYTILCYGSTLFILCLLPDHLDQVLYSHTRFDYIDI